MPANAIPTPRISNLWSADNPACVVVFDCGRLVVDLRTGVFFDEDADREAREGLFFVRLDELFVPFAFVPDFVFEACFEPLAALLFEVDAGLCLEVELPAIMLVPVFFVHAGILVHHTLEIIAY
jgi:hypothetical protein